MQIAKLLLYCLVGDVHYLSAFFFVFNIVTFIKRGRIIFLQLLKLHAALVSIASIGPKLEHNALGMPFSSLSLRAVSKEIFTRRRKLQHTYSSDATSQYIKSV